MALKNATVKLAEEAGSEKLAPLAHAAGIKSVQATPAMALGAYDATPVDMAGAHTPLAHAGARTYPLPGTPLLPAPATATENICLQHSQRARHRPAHGI